MHEALNKSILKKQQDKNIGQGIATMPEKKGGSIDGINRWQPGA
ncbi:hypothetical protein [Pseudoramibacter faecis]|nr:hypothetical protein [Pseudoramibacter sp. HA2172]